MNKEVFWCWLCHKPHRVCVELEEHDYEPCDCCCAEEQGANAEEAHDINSCGWCLDSLKGI